MVPMKRTIAIRLVPTDEQIAKLAALQVAFAAACNLVAPIAVEHRTTNRVRLHHLAYYLIRERVPALGAQLTCNAIAAVARSLKAYRANRRGWMVVQRRSSASVHLDARTYRLDGEVASIFTMSGRERFGMRMGAFQRAYLERGRVKEAELLARRNRWYLHVVLDLPDTEPVLGGGILGVDLGENVAAATSGGTLHGGGQLRDTQDRYVALRARLQGNGSQSARQLLTKVSGRESRHVRHVNHQISAKIVAEARENGSGTIAMENLTNIRSRITMGKRMRTRLHRWSWRQLQQFVAYKAQAIGISVVYVDPAYTSQTCSACGVLGKRVRHRFSCQICGIFAHSDRNAARNIAKIGASALAPTGDVMRPHVAA
jgi:IS605 OrfB family transposase